MTHKVGGSEMRRGPKPPQCELGGDDIRIIGRTFQAPKESAHIGTHHRFSPRLIRIALQIQSTKHAVFEINNTIRNMKLAILATK